MAMVKGGKGDGEFDVDRLLDFEKRSGIKDGDIESFITKVDAVNVAIQAMKDGELDPADVHVDGVPTIEEELQMAAEKRRRRIDLERREREERSRKKKEEHEKWWRGAELLYGERKRLSGVGALEKSTHAMEAESSGGGHLSHTSGSTRSLTDEERLRLKDRYSMEYGRWDTWTPTDPATLAEIEGREEEEDAKRSKEFETNNPDFCTQMIDDMKTRSEASDKKDSEATAARLKGNRFYRAKRWGKALELYMASLRARPYTVNTLANVAQTLIKLERWSDALDFCDRALHVDGACVKALSRRASVFVNLAGQCLAASSDATAATATTTTTATPTPTPTPIATAAATAAAATRVVSPGSIDVEVGEAKGDATVVSGDMSSVLNRESREAIGAAGGGGENTGDGKAGGGGENAGGGNDDDDDDGGGADQALYDRFGGREGLLALALVDLETAVKADPESEDVRRQRDALKTEIDEEKVEAEVMKIARSVPRAGSPNISVANSSEREKGEDPKPCSADGDKENNLMRESQRSTSPLDGMVNDTGTPEVALLPGSGTTPTVGDVRVGKVGRVGAPVARDDGATSVQTVTGEDDFATVDRALEAALGEGVTAGQGLRGTTKKENVDYETIAALQSLPLLHLATVLEASCSARVYFRASGGLARLAGATRAASLVATAADADHRTGHCADPPTENVSIKTPSTPDTAVAAAAAELSTSHEPSEASGGGISEANPFNKEGTGDGALYEHGEKSGLTAADAGNLTRRLELMLRALAAALLGGERLAQQDVLKSGLLDGPCGKALLMVSDQDDKKGSAAIGRTVDVAGAAATVLSRVVDDPHIRAHISRSAPLISGVLGLIGAGSATPLDVEAAAAILSTVLLGRTASAAAKTLLQDTTAVKVRGSPTMIVAEALLAWKEGGGLMQGAPPSTGSSLCGVLANLAMHEEFRGSFAESSPPGTTGRGGKEKIAPVKALVLVAGDTKARCSEVRPLALAALVNACLHQERVQTATLSAGGLALALAVLSLEGEERARHYPPLVSARSAGLLARLSTLPAALEVMVRPGVIDRIIKATVRSAALGSNLYATTAKPRGNPDPADEPAGAAHAMEREHLVRTLATVLRSSALTNTPRPKGTVPSPSSTVNTAAAPEGRGGIADTAQTLGLAEALVSFLPPARQEGFQGVTSESVALKPTWSAAPALTANVGGCLLHLMDGECSRQITEQVVAAGGIPRLVSLFANSGAEGGAKSARTNAAICLAKLAREPRHKEAIAKLRGMEMLVQAGAGLAV